MTTSPSSESTTLSVNQKKLGTIISALRTLDQVFFSHTSNIPAEKKANGEDLKDPLDEISSAIKKLTNHLEQSREGNEMIHELLQSAMEPVPLQDQLDQTLMLLFYLSWLPVQSKGAIYLLDQKTATLILHAYTAIDQDLLPYPKEVALGEGPCAMSTITKQFHQSSRRNKFQEVTSAEAEPPGQCCIPINGGDQLLGIIHLVLQDGKVLGPEHQIFLNSVASVLEVIIIRKGMDAEILSILDAQKKANEQLDKYNSFIRSTFGRYMSDEVVDSILDTPKGLQLGGEQKLVTVLMTDLRGFTAIGERLQPEKVLSMLNMYLEVMTEIILRYNGTIIEFLGDGILALFGAPITREDDAQRAVACALEMQQSMPQVNVKNLEH